MLLIFVDLNQSNDCDINVIMLNVMSGTTVKVAITLQECENIADQQSDIPTRMAASSVGGGQQQQQQQQQPNYCSDGLIACLVHPFLLPPHDGLCRSRGRHQGIRWPSPCGGNVADTCWSSRIYHCVLLNRVRSGHPSYRQLSPRTPPAVEESWMTPILY